MAETAFPLTWPISQARTKSINRIPTAPFTVGENYDAKVSHWENGQHSERIVKKHRSKEVSVALARERLEGQLDKLGADHPVLSTNIELTLSGIPKSGRRDPDDPGAAVWFTLQGKRLVFACDKWVRCADNIAALAAHIRAIRSVENYGVGTLEQAFRGYQALPAPNADKPWRQVLTDCNTLEAAEARYRERAHIHHPDKGGNPIQMAELNVAIRAARKEFGATA
jgi:hypothetical protein